MSIEVSMLIKGTQFVFWKDIRISRNIDTVSEASFNAPFDFEAEGFKENFAPFAYNPIIVSVNGKPLFTGTMVDVTPVVSDTRTIQVTCYSTCGVLMDCTPPEDKAPFEYNNLNLKEIAEKMAEYFKLTVEFQGDPGAKFARVACDPDKKVFDFLTELSKQRGFVMSSNVDGALLFWKSEDGQPVAMLDEGVSPLLEVSPDFNPQEFYSDLTGLAPVEVGKAAVKKTVKPKKEKDDPKLKKEKATPAKAVAKAPKPATKYSKFSARAETEVFRPLTFKIDDAEGADVETATKAKLARMLGNMAKYTIQVATWFDSSGDLWAPNTKIKLRAPNAMIYDFYEFEIKSVEFALDASSETATLELSLPGSFSGEPPEIFPWEL